MTATSVIHIAENSPEHVAYRMMRDVFLVENKPFDSLTRDEYLDTFDECLEAVKGFRKRKAAAGG
jgi:hypothetical protein